MKKMSGPEEITMRVLLCNGVYIDLMESHQIYIYNTQPVYSVYSIRYIEERTSRRRTQQREIENKSGFLPLTIETY